MSAVPYSIDTQKGKMGLVPISRFLSHEAVFSGGMQARCLDSCSLYCQVKCIPNVKRMLLLSPILNLMQWYPLCLLILASLHDDMLHVRMLLLFQQKVDVTSEFV
jgi:hypothetical protein